MRDVNGIAVGKALDRSAPGEAAVIKNPRLSLDAEDLLGHVLATMPGGLFTVDDQGRITSWNRGMEDMTGYPAAEALGRTCDFLKGSTCFAGPCATSGQTCALFTQGHVHGKRCSLMRRDGSRVSVVKNARLMIDGRGKRIGGIEAVTDITGLVELEQEVETLRSVAAGRAHMGRLIGNHPAMQQLYDFIEVAGRVASSVLIQGETGTGKELVAHAIHLASARSQGPFIKMSCAAMPDGLLESELFGHIRGAFTGAVADRKGRFAAADGGTIFLDEIGDISPAMQTRLLRVLQEREFERVGDNRSIHVDIRVIAATHQDLQALCDQGKFRRDLYYRLAVVPVVVPPLRQRRSDIPLLVEHFLNRLVRLQGREVAGISPEALHQLSAARWPGNVRELENAVEYAYAVCQGGVLTPSCLPPGLTAADESPALLATTPRDAEEIRRVLQACGGNRTRAAAELGVSRMTLWKWLKKLGID
jgi:PAS domain S-box-containing protein